MMPISQVVKTVSDRVSTPHRIVESGVPEEARQAWKELDSSVELLIVEECGKPPKKATAWLVLEISGLVERPTSEQRKVNRRRKAFMLRCGCASHGISQKCVNSNEVWTRMEIRKRHFRQ